MDLLLFVILVLLTWILYELVKSDHTNSCTDAETPDLQSPEKVIDSIPEEEEPSADDGPDRSGGDEAQEETDGADGFLVYEECTSEGKCDIRRARLMSKDNGSNEGVCKEYEDDDDDDRSAAMLEDDQRDKEVPKTSDDDDPVMSEDEHHDGAKLRDDSEFSDVDPNRSMIFALEDHVSDLQSGHETNILKSISVQRKNETTSDELKSDFDSLNRGDKAAIMCISPALEVRGTSLPKEPNGTEAKTMLAEEAAEVPVKETSVRVLSSGLVDDEGDGEQLDKKKPNEEIVEGDVGPTYQQIELAYVADAADAAAECPATAGTPLSDLTIDVEVDVDVREAKVLIVPDPTSATPNTVVSVIFSKCESPSFTDSEGIIGTDSSRNPKNLEGETLSPKLNELEENYSADDNNKTAEAEMKEDSAEQGTEHCNPDVTEHCNPDVTEHCNPDVSGLENRCTEIIARNVDIDDPQDQQMVIYVESIENLPGEISIPTAKEVEFRKKVEFTEISDEEEILYRNVTKSGTEEYTEEISTKNEVSSVITSEDTPFDQQFQTSTSTTKVVSMSYTTEECFTENIEMKSIGSNLLDNPNAVVVHNYQHEEKLDFKTVQANGERDETVSAETKVYSSSILQPENLSDSAIEDNKENLSLYQVVDHDTNTSLKKKPACGVFLFGGEELLNKIKTRRVIIDEYEKEGKGSDEGWRLSTTNEGMTEYKEQQATSTSHTTKTSQRTHTMQQTKQQTRSVTRSQKTDVAFELSTHLDLSDQPRIAFPEEPPVDVNTVTSSTETETELIPAFETESLVHMNKDRVRGDLRRRRPEKAKE